MHYIKLLRISILFHLLLGSCAYSYQYRNVESPYLYQNSSCDRIKNKFSDEKIRIHKDCASQCDLLVSIDLYNFITSNSEKFIACAQTISNLELILGSSPNFVVTSKKSDLIEYTFIAVLAGDRSVTQLIKFYSDSTGKLIKNDQIFDLK